MHYTLRELASLTGAEPVGDLDYVISGVEGLQEADSRHVSFLENPRYLRQLENSKAGVVFIPPMVSPIEGRHYLITRNPSLAFQIIVELFCRLPTSGFSNRHKTAVIHEEAIIADNVVIGPYVTIDRLAKIEEGSFIGASCFIGAGVTIGASCNIHPHVVIREGCVIGNRVTIQPGAVIGSCGFGYHTDNYGKHTPLKQLGIVVVEDDVDIGANVTIDRARFKETRVGRGTKIDNLVQIAHQVEIGQDNLIVSQVGIAGSTKTGKNVVVGGQVGIAGHLTIGDGVMLAARSGVSKSLLEKGTYYGAPAEPAREFGNHYAQVRSIGKWIQRIKDLEAKVEELTSTSDTN